MKDKNYLKKGFSYNFAIIPTALLNCTFLSWEAKGLLCYILDKPEGWDFTYAGIAAQGMDKVGSVKRIADQLKAVGILKIKQIRDLKTKRFIGNEWDISNFQKMFPQGGFPAGGTPEDGNPTQVILNKKDSSKKYSDIEKNSDITNAAVESLPSQKKKKEPRYKMSQEEQALLKEMIDFVPSRGKQLEASFITAMFRDHGVEKVKKAWDFCKTKEIKSTLGGLLRKAIEAGWEAPSDEFKENKRICEEFAKMAPSRLNITQSYLTCPEMSKDVDFKLPTKEVIVLLETIKKRLGLKTDPMVSEEIVDLGEFDS